MQPDHRLTQAFVRDHPQEVARRVETLLPEEAATILSPLSPQEIASVTEHLLPALGYALLKQLTPEVASEVTGHLPSSSSVAILRHCDEQLRNKILDGLDSRIRGSLRQSLTYPEWTAGSLADPWVLTLSPDNTVGEALARIKRDQRRNTTYYIYVLERDNTLTGVVTLKQLLVGEPHHLIGTIMHSQVVTLSAEISTDELLQHPNWRQFHTMPVIDRQGAFLGGLRYRTLRKLEEEGFPQSTPMGLSHALISLWEAYALAGIRIMTDVAGALTTQPPISQPPEKE